MKEKRRSSTLIIEGEEERFALRRLECFEPCFKQFTILLSVIVKLLGNECQGPQVIIMPVKRVLADCVVLSLQDSSVFYPSCRGCFSRIDVEPQDGTR